MEEMKTNLTLEEKRAIEKRQLLGTIYARLDIIDAVDWNDECVAVLSRVCDALSMVLEAVGEEV